MEAVLPVRVVWLFERDKMYLWKTDVEESTLLASYRVKKEVS